MGKFAQDQAGSRCLLCGGPLGIAPGRVRSAKDLYKPGLPASPQRDALARPGRPAGRIEVGGGGFVLSAGMHLVTCRPAQPGYDRAKLS